VEALDWNCQQHIVPRFSEEEIRDALEPLERQMYQLQEDNKKLREQVAQLSKK
jgi:cell division septum initiation protein DivIVA